MAKLTPEFVQQEMEVIGRLETKIAAELGALRDEVRVLARSISEANARADKLVDRMIQMSMVHAGAFREAVAQGRVVASDPAYEQRQNTDDWGKEEDVWPPEGHVVMNVP